MKIVKLLLFPVALLVGAAMTSAAPVTYTFAGNWTNSSTGDFGASYLATLVLDNGGHWAALQTFEQTDFVSARIQSGAYDFTMTPGDMTSWSTDFSSDALGQITLGWFDAQSADNTWHFDLEFQDENFSNANGSAGYFQDHASNRGTVTATAVPATPLYTLILLALGVCSTAGRRLHTAAKCC